MKRPIRTLINDLIQIASELEEFEVSLNQFLGIGNLVRGSVNSDQGGETPKSVPFQELVPQVDGQRRTWSKHPKAKLSKQEKAQIRLLYKQGQSVLQLMETYNSNKQQINGILKNNTIKAQEAIKARTHSLN